MEKDFLGDRKKALEDSFFDKHNKELVERLRLEKRRAAAKEGLAEIAGIADEALLDKLVGLGLDPSTWAALFLVPLIEVAWADGSVDDRERRAVLRAAEQKGVEPGSPSFELLEGWLARRPEGRLLEAWGEYIVELCASLSPDEQTSLKKDILGRARAVAEAAGGILGLMNKVSPEEEVVLQELAKAFRR